MECVLDKYSKDIAAQERKQRFANGMSDLGQLHLMNRYLHKINNATEVALTLHSTKTKSYNSAEV
jgi:hypothetical protein